MMRLKPFLKNLVRAALLSPLILAVFILISLYGCLDKIEPTYKEKDIPQVVKKICKEEYNLDVTTKRTSNTLWVYAPLSKILHEDYATKEDKIFDEEISDKLRNILTTIGRVLISSDETPDFFALVASDINKGLDYALIANTLDIKKSYAEYIPWTEANRRYVIKFQLAPQAIGDTTGEHLEVYDIKLPDFLAEQMAQRIELRFSEGELKNSFKVEPIKSYFENKSFKFYIDIKKINEPKEPIDIIKEALKIIVYVIQTYDFNDFLGVEIHDLNSGKEINYGRLTLDEFITN